MQAGWRGTEAMSISAPGTSGPPRPTYASTSPFAGSMLTSAPFVASLSFNAWTCLATVFSASLAAGRTGSGLRALFAADLDACAAFTCSFCAGRAGAWAGALVSATTWRDGAGWADTGAAWTGAGAAFAAAGAAPVDAGSAGRRPSSSI